ncbi:cytochrome P450 [Xylaria bambusicola]|uniref:cytochrome P450 n=1 Tax=Xylaria bambusicola TaxID=326684 RepID=UPI0020082CC2|nr:cytochrome P450 [Xylaria bambusicola]KAI0525582.1 cytochrome P450 [Xylaria bambusicola]
MDFLQAQNLSLTPATNDITHQIQANGRFIYYAALSIIVFCVWHFHSPKHGPHVSAPFYEVSRLRWMFNADALIKDSYCKFRDSVYQIRSTEGVRTIIPPTLVGELKGLPEDTLSAKTAVSEAMLSEYTHLSADAHSDVLTLLLKTKATHHLQRMVPTLKEELQFILDTEFPVCEDWTPFRIQPFMVRAVSRLSGRVFVGSTLSRSEEWLQVSVSFAVTAFIAVTKLQFFPPWMRPVAQYFVSELKTIRKDLAKAQTMLQPLIEERLSYADGSDQEKPDDFIQWLSDALPEEEKRNYFIQAKMQLLLSASSIHTTSNLTTDCIYDLAVHQDMQDILRDEVAEAFAEDDAWERKDTIGRLKKMDSFIKESQRLSSNITSFIRKVMKPIDLSDGTHLPSGTSVLTPLAGMSSDERYFSDPEVFDGLRFWKLRQQKSPSSTRSPSPSSTSSTTTHRKSSTSPRSSSPANNSSKYQFTSIGDTNQNFGLGKHACPGRFFAAQEIKIILSYLLLNYDIKLRDGEARPAPVVFMMTKSPSQTTEVLFRRRKT